MNLSGMDKMIFGSMLISVSWCRYRMNFGAEQWKVGYVLCLLSSTMIRAGRI